MEEQYHAYNDRIPTFDVLHKFNQDYRVIFVGDATMSPYELTSLGGSVEHYNDETGIVWLQRFVTKFPNIVWLNPTNEYYWDGVPTIKAIKEILKSNVSNDFRRLNTNYENIKGKK